jgi:YD repeat-containing protein
MEKRTWKRGLRWLCIGLIIIGLVIPLNLVAKATKGVLADPFVTMYDSDAIFRQEIEQVLEMEIQQRQVSVEETRTAEEISAQIGLESLVPERVGLDLSNQDETAYISRQQGLAREAQADLRDLKEQVFTALERDNLAGLAVIELEEQSRRMIENLYERDRTDRFLIKYKEDGDKSWLLNRINVVETAEVNLSPARNDSADKNKDLDLSNDSRLQRIVLNEKVNPAELAAELKAAGLANEIEYMQPDFLLEYASLEPELVEIDSEDRNQEHEKEADVEEDLAVELEEEFPEAAILDEDEEDEEEALEELLQPAPVQAQSGVIVALIDTGVDVNHPALEENLINGWDFVDNTTLVHDANQPLAAAHGTHIAGIIAENSDPESVKIMPLRVFGEHGAYTSDILAAIGYAQAHGASIVNCSFGSSSYNLALEEAMANSAMLFVAAAGNARSDIGQAPVYPAAFNLDNVISVASLNEDKGFSYFSNYSVDLVDISARGRDVYSTLPESGYGLQSGTSQAAGYVSAAAASVLSENDSLVAAVLKTRLTETGDRYEHLLNKVKQGRSLNLIQALLGAPVNEIQTIAYEEDFDIHGYQATQSEVWALYTSAGDVMQVAAGAYHTLILKENGTVWAWGNNEDGRLGDGTTTSRSAPVQVSGLTGATAIAVGAYHSLALKSDGTVWAWGYNASGQLGDGTTTNRSTPVQVSGLTGVTAIAAGLYHSLALKPGGTVWGWGYNALGQLGDGTTINRSTPVQVSGLTSVTAIKGGYIHSLALKSDGTVWAWGYNNYGQLGDGTTTNRSTPVQVSGLTGITVIAAAVYHNLALKPDGTVRAWGNNSFGQLGDGTTTTRSTPVQVSGLTGVTAIAVGLYHNLALKPDGTVRAWGYNYYGQLGDGTTTNRITPVQVSGLTDPFQSGHYTYNANNQLISIEFASGAIIEYTYDANGNMISQTVSQ